MFRHRLWNSGGMSSAGETRMLHKQGYKKKKIRNILFRITHFSATYGTDTAYERGCTAVTNPAEYVCQDIGKDNQVRVQQIWDSL